MQSIGIYAQKAYGCWSGLQNQADNAWHGNGKDM